MLRELRRSHRASAAQHVGNRRILAKAIATHALELGEGQRREQEGGARHAPLAPGQSLRAAPQVRRTRARGHHEHVSQFARVEQLLEPSLPIRDRRDLVDEETPHSRILAEPRQETAHGRDEPLDVGELVPVQIEARRGSRRADRGFELSLEPRALAVLTWPADEQHSGLRGQCREPEVDLEDEPTAAQALEVRNSPGTSNWPSCRCWLIDLTSTTLTYRTFATLATTSALDALTIHY
jgi:hypothetical protein